MKLSEAINLGAVTVKMVRDDMNSCALGAACNALGAPRHVAMNPCHPNNRYSFLRSHWGWLDKLLFTRTDMDGSFDGYEAIWSRFDNDVVSYKTMTLEQLIDYVASIEPSCGECNKFDCDCIKTSDGAEGLSEAKEEVLACSRS